MSQLAALQECKSLRGVAKLLDVKPGMLAYLLYIKPKSSAMYAKFAIPKRSGGTREICAPVPELKLIQFRLSRLLQRCADEINAKLGFAEDAEHSGIAHGFKRHHSIMTNARVHKTRRYVFNVDIQDFFGSINFGRVYGFFIKNKHFALKPSVATVIAQIACYEGKLPQGSPCSPVISNLIGHLLDVRLVQLAKATGSSYSRYADDLTFSSNRRDFPSRIAFRPNPEFHDWQAGSGLKRWIAKNGFELNEKKTRMQYRDSRQEVTGLSVNRKVNSRSDYRRTVRSMVYRLITTGTFEHTQVSKGPDGQEVVTATAGRTSQLRGMLSFIDQVDQFNAKLYKKERTAPPASTSREALFRQFILFDAFYSAETPVLICEGETDNVYLSSAIHQMIAKYPSLATETSRGVVRLRVRLHRYSNKVNKRVLKLGGGTGDLAGFIAEYHKQVATKFKAPGAKLPVVILIDNDSGKGPVLDAVKRITKTPVDETATFTRVFANLYLVLTPLIADAKESCIEDCFDAATLKITHQGKPFNPSNKRDSSPHYGKTVFAHEVIRPNAKKIDFSGFASILDRVQAVLDYHQALATVP